MNIAQHLVLTLVFILGTSARAQETETPQSTPVETPQTSSPATTTNDATPEAPPSAPASAPVPAESQAAPEAAPSAQPSVQEKAAPPTAPQKAVVDEQAPPAPSATPEQVAQPQATATPSPTPVTAAKKPAPAKQKAATSVSGDEVPGAKRSLLRTVSNKDFNKPLFFDQVDNGVLLPPLELEYDLSDGGKSLRVGNQTLNEKDFFFALVPLNKAHSQLGKVVAGSAGEKVALLMAWPDKLLNNGTLEMISKTGSVLWKYDFSKADQEKWVAQVTAWRKELNRIGVLTPDPKAGIFGTQFGIEDVKGAGAPFWGLKDTFRFCITQTEGRNHSKLCSQQYGTRANGRSIVMGKVRVDPTTPRVLFQNEEAPLKNSVVVSTEAPVSFYAELATGESYEFITLPNKLQLMDIADSTKPGLLRIVGYDTRPLQPSILLNPDQYSALTKILGFESTIGDPRKFWASNLSKDDPKLYLPGQGGGVFKQRFELSEIPARQARVYLSKDTPSGTYIDGIELEGRKLPTAHVRSSQNSAKVSKKNPSVFVWDFKATERGQINRSYLDVTYEGKTYHSYYEIYKGYPRELSGRFTAVKTQGDFVVLGEIAYNQWFEDLFGWTNYWASRQRWGISATYFKSFNDLKVSTTDSAPLSVWNVDLKYRLSPGLWGRDETVGLLASYQSVTFDQLKAPMLGGGAFWARSMPKVLDDIFNLLPLFRYPKWVDVEFIYYAQSMDSNVKLNSSMSLNFHGKVLWTQRYFGEAGFGLKRYAFTDSSLNQKAELNSFYGTVGLGINF